MVRSERTMMAVDLCPALDERRLRATLDEALRRARQQGRVVMTSNTMRVPASDPLEFFARAARLPGERLFFMHPSDGYALAGAGTAWTIEGHGAERFDHSARTWRDLMAGA